MPFRTPSRVQPKFATDHTKEARERASWQLAMAAVNKERIARAIANETDCTFRIVNGPEIIGGAKGQSEENIRKLFAEAIEVVEYRSQLPLGCLGESVR